MREGHWDQHFGRTYDQNWKEESIERLLQEFDQDERLGNVIVDIGSGAWPVSRNLQKDGRRMIEVDIAGEEYISEDSAQLRYDVERLGDNSFTTKKILKKVSDFLGLEDMRSASPEQIDTVILSDILNYVDYAAVLKNLNRHLKPQGRVFIFNLPNRGIRTYFSEPKLNSNQEIVDLLQGLGYTIEEPASLGEPPEVPYLFVMKKPEAKPNLP